MTGQPFDGYAKYAVNADLLDNPTSAMDTNYPLTLVSYKQGWHSMARTICNPWLVSIQCENFVEISRADADPLGISTGDNVIVKSSSHMEGSVGRAFVTETIRPGVIAVAHSFGHWEMSSRSHKLNGVNSDFDSTRGAGIASCPIMRTDPIKNNVALQDKVGGSVSFFGTRVQVTKI
jgi:anaerobic selenocysteine-containing dehydrogenase